ncbi:MAG TPA: 16S rRNA (adenine(1518)-N(6)/adenine(1519)-N(6))-dimethyltransferase RsmA [Burkholderiales bacterium]|nr:16S rRNA (adenine(1518)-N(6)/adenine(1519)-N(6))-dimethyltransferase RsmA [Burkholderiales bacterium]
MSAPHRARKRFSQNFLVDEAAIGAIVGAIAPRAGDRMVEIGPGLGALTRPLARIVRPLHVVEIDRDIVARLRSAFMPDTLVIHEGDALEFDFAALGPQLRVVGNLPYHISSPLLFHLAHGAAAIADIHVMLQAEVVDRVVAAPGDSEYGRLSVMLQYRFALERVLEVPPSAFKPAPKVDSAVVRLMPLRERAPAAADEKLFADTVARAFSQRRKTLRNTLGRVLSATDFATLEIDPQARAQTLSVDDFVRIANFRADAGGGASGSEPKKGR